MYVTIGNWRLPRCAYRVEGGRVTGLTEVGIWMCRVVQMVKRGWNPVTVHIEESDWPVV